SALYHIVEALTRWVAPILSFTADEIWQVLPGKRSESVMLETWYEGLTELNEDAAMGRNFWETVKQAKDAVNFALELKRKEGVIGSSLEAEVVIYCEEQEQIDTLQRLSDELRFVTLTSVAAVDHRDNAPRDESTATYKVDGGPSYDIAVIATKEAKCERCWHHRADVGSNSEHEELCGRCVENVAGDGELRQFA
ncbi:MAG: class I tRNA ligase family protein, partial [Marinobacterium sp.]|nr:class I tRNA ligase family protein [Marinobacterium sp.]